MTRFLVLGALALTALLWNCGGAEKPKGQVDPMPVIPDSIRNRAKLPIEQISWRLLSYTKDGAQQRLEGGDSTSIALKFEYNEAKGSFGCNDFRIDCTVDSTGNIVFGDNLTHSSRICRGLMAQEKWLKEVLPTMKTYTITPDYRRLELSSGGDVKLLYVGTGVSGEGSVPKVRVLE